MAGMQPALLPLPHQHCPCCNRTHTPTQLPAHPPAACAPHLPRQWRPAGAQPAAPPPRGRTRDVPATRETGAEHLDAHQLAANRMSLQWPAACYSCGWRTPLDAQQLVPNSVRLHMSATAACTAQHCFSYTRLRTWMHSTWSPTAYISTGQRSEEASSVAPGGTSSTCGQEGRAMNCKPFAGGCGCTGAHNTACGCCVAVFMGTCGAPSGAPSVCASAVRPSPQQCAAHLVLMKLVQAQRVGQQARPSGAVCRQPLAGLGRHCHAAGSHLQRKARI